MSMIATKQIDKIIPEEKIRSAMSLLGLSQVDIAARLGVKQQQVSRLVNRSSGKIPDSLLELLDILGLELTLKPKEDSALTAAGVPYTGDKETDWWLQHHPEVLERANALESGTVQLIPIEEVARELGVDLA